MTSSPGNNTAQSGPVKKSFLRKSGGVVKTGAVYLSGWPALRASAKSLANCHNTIWSRIFYRPKAKYKNDTFKKACLRHDIGAPGGRTLEDVMSQLKSRKRLNTVLSLMCIFSLAASIFQVNFYMFLTALLATIYAVLQWFYYSFRLWQCERQKLLGISDFWEDEGLVRMFQF